MLKIVLREAGVLDDVNIEYFTWSDGFSALKDGRVDACVGTWGNGVPPAGIIELLTVRDINILSLPPEVGAKIHEINPGIMAQDLTHAECNIIPEGDPRLSPVNAGVMIFHADVPEESVYEFTRACISNIEELGKITQDLKPLKDYVTSVCVEDVPFHPGAARALKEGGAVGRPLHRLRRITEPRPAARRTGGGAGGLVPRCGRRAGRPRRQGKRRHPCNSVTCPAITAGATVRSTG